jgi:hypothetical protein
MKYNNTCHVVLLGLIWLLSINLCTAQKVTISNEVNVKFDKEYEIVGELEDRVVLYRESGNDKSYTYFDDKLRKIYDRDIVLETKRAKVMANIPYDSTIHMLYNYSLDSNFTAIRRYDKTGLCLDTTIIYYSSSRRQYDDYKLASSEDRKSTLILNFDYKNGMTFNLLDHQSLSLTASFLIPIEDKRNIDNFVSLELSNDGLVYLLFEKYNSKFNRDRHEFYLLSMNLNTGEFIEELIPCRDVVTVDVKTKYDNKNGVYNIIGLYSEKDRNSAEGVFHFRKSGIFLDTVNYILLNEFDGLFYQELYKDKIKEQLENHQIKNIQFTNDGGVILLSEHNKVFSRRSPFQGYGNAGVGGAWTDHYIEEVVILSLSPDLDIRWKTILLKKQFSQDDGGVYSSFFLFELPSRFKIIFNDDIKRNNMVSEFELYPSGKLIRKSLLSTEYQNLKIRFDGAIQTSNHSFLVPSEKSGKLKIVKVSY